MSEWKITGDCVYEEMCDNGVVPKQRVICYMHPDATAKDRHIVVNAQQMHNILKECYNFLKRFAFVIMETKNSSFLDYLKEFDGLPARIKEALDKTAEEELLLGGNYNGSEKSME